MERSGWEVGTDIGLLFGTLATVPKQASYIGSHATRLFLMRLERSGWYLGTVSRVPTRGPIAVPRSQPDLSKRIQKTLGGFY